MVGNSYCFSDQNFLKSIGTGSSSNIIFENFLILFNFQMFNVIIQVGFVLENALWTPLPSNDCIISDMFLTSNSLSPYITNFEKYPSFRSDHNPIILTIDYSNFKRGKGFWKHNAMLLKDTEYINRINSSIKVNCAKYLKNANYGNFNQDSTENELNDFLSLDVKTI